MYGISALSCGFLRSLAYRVGGRGELRVDQLFGCDLGFDAGIPCVCSAAGYEAVPRDKHELNDHECRMPDFPLIQAFRSIALDRAAQEIGQVVLCTGGLPNTFQFAHCPFLLPHAQPVRHL